ncbi:hypothetical protein [Pseudomonas sp. 37 R 15]|uniref:hypothetical protein n=1 Tax=Pseudomonas sp. 37 R 15 TaxID=1844104 RepID=UPI000811FAF5|nr:hypothetical protein [Pseudomonas sp. 37 R 15]CRM22164.1 hypothetical protein [Pseudomonas sp. 37 R 15]
MPTPIAESPTFPTTWTLHTVPAYTEEQDPALEQRARSAQAYFNTLQMYAEDTHPDSVRQLESQRPASLPPSYWQATNSISPQPARDANDEQDTANPSTHQDATQFSPHLSGRALSQAVKHVHRLDRLLERAEQLGALLMSHGQEQGTSIDLETVGNLWRKIGSLKNSWANGAFAGSSQLVTQLAGQCLTVPRALKENDLKAAIDNLWNIAQAEYRDVYLPDPLSASPILAQVYRLAEELKNADI